MSLNEVLILRTASSAPKATEARGETVSVLILSGVIVLGLSFMVISPGEKVPRASLTGSPRAQSVHDDVEITVDKLVTSEVVEVYLDLISGHVSAAVSEGAGGG